MGTLDVSTMDSGLTMSMNDRPFFRVMASAALVGKTRTDGDIILCTISRTEFLYGLRSDAPPPRKLGILPVLWLLNLFSGFQQLGSADTPQFDMKLKIKMCENLKDCGEPSQKLSYAPDRWQASLSLIFRLYLQSRRRTYPPCRIENPSLGAPPSLLLTDPGHAWKWHEASQVDQQR